MPPAAKQRIPELSGIEFTGHAAITEYSKTLRALMRDLAYELDFAAEEIQAVLSRQRGHPLLFGIDVRLRARKVAKRLRRASELCAGAAVEAVKFYQEFRKQFAEVINPQRAKPRQAFDFNDD
jgi:hypothetical protein